jgi:hypothetical protein
MRWRCAWCAPLLTSTEDATDIPITHGICPACAAKAVASISRPPPLPEGEGRKLGNTMFVGEGMPIHAPKVALHVAEWHREVTGEDLPPPPDEA